MAMLESTPYRVYYLINCPWNTCGHRYIWDLKELADGELYYYTYIRAVMTKPNDFSSVIVKATGITDAVMSDNGNYVYENSSDYADMPWDDIDDGIVKVINDYYNDSRRVGYREQQIRFADKVEKLLTDSNSFKVVINSKGFPKVEVKGLPYLTMDPDLGDANVTLELDKFGNDYRYTIDTGLDDIIEASGKELHQFIRDSKNYDKLQKSLAKLTLGLEV